MKKLMVILILAAVLSGCLNEERTYIAKGDEKNIIVLKTDSTYEWSAEGYLWTGEYEEDTDSVILKLSPPLPSIKFEKSGTNLNYKKDVWVLQR